MRGFFGRDGLFVRVGVCFCSFGGGRLFIGFGGGAGATWVRFFAMAGNLTRQSLLYHNKV